MPERKPKLEARSLPGKVRRGFKEEKNAMYAHLGGGSQPEAINEIYLMLARRFNMPVRQVKDMVNPNGYMD